MNYYEIERFIMITGVFYLLQNYSTSILHHQNKNNTIDLSGEWASGWIRMTRVSWEMVQYGSA